MNLGIFGLLLAQVAFSWEAPPAEYNITKVEIHVTATKGDYSQAQIINAGMPPVVNGKQSFNAMIDVSKPRWAVIRGLNSFGLSDPGSEIFLGKPQPLAGFNAAPAAN